MAVTFFCCGPELFDVFHTLNDAAAAAVLVTLRVMDGITRSVMSTLAEATGPAVGLFTMKAKAVLGDEPTLSDETMLFALGRIGSGKLLMAARGFERMPVTSPVVSLLSPLTS